MRIRMIVAVTAAVLVTGATVVPAAAAGASAPVVTSVQVAGSGPGDPIRIDASGFTPGTAPTVVVAAKLDGATTPMPPAVVAADGRATLPADARSPAALVPGVYRLLLTDASGIQAPSPWFSIVAPRVLFPASLTPGAPRLLPQARLGLSGLASSPGTVRTVTIDGIEVPNRWYGDENAFADPDTTIAVPTSLGVGDHTVVFSQTGATPYSVSARVPVLAPTVSVPNPVAPRSRVWITVDRGGWQDEFTVRIVGTAHDVHTGTIAGGASTNVTASVDVDGLSVGPATVTVTSKHNGATASAAFVVDGASVTSPAGLLPGGRLVTADGRIQLVMRADGTLGYGFVGYAPTWSTRTQGHPGARLVVQSDGNVVIRAANGATLWTTGTQGIGPGARLALDSHDEIAVFTASGRQAWSTFLAGGAPLLPGLTANQYLFRGQALSANLTGVLRGAAYFTMQDDGNVVLRTPDHGVLWTSRTQGHPNSYLVLQGDGNLVLRGPDGRALWANGARGTGVRLVAQSDGNVVEYSSAGRALWATGTVIG